jgi:hypothetical protein
MATSRIRLNALLSLAATAAGCSHDVSPAKQHAEPATSAGSRLSPGSSSRVPRRPGLGAHSSSISKRNERSPDWIRARLSTARITAREVRPAWPRERTPELPDTGVLGLALGQALPLDFAFRDAPLRYTRRLALAIQTVGLAN